MTPNQLLPEDLLKKIEQEAETEYPISRHVNQLMNDRQILNRERYVKAVTPYAQKLDIAMKALERISSSSEEYLAIEIADNALKQLNNG